MTTYGPLIPEINEIINRGLAASRWPEYSLNRLTKPGAGIYVQQHGLFTRHSRRAWAYVVGQCPEVEVRRFIVRENLYEEEGIEEKSHFLSLVRLGTAVGLTPDDVRDATPLPSTRAALLIWETLTKDRHWLIGCAAKATLEQMSMPEVGRSSYTQGMAWMRQLGISKEEADFWLLHDELDRVHGSGAFDFVEKYLPAYPQVRRSDVLTAVEDSTFAFAMFWSGIADAAESLIPA
jgi:pyrroloquinoline quinone (PQQ) biosynthesis protein C